MKPASHNNTDANHDHRSNCEQNVMRPPNPIGQIYNPVGGNITIFTNKYLRQTNNEISQLNYGTVATPFGNALLGWCADGICALTFCAFGPESQLLKLKRKWPSATLNHESKPATKLAAKIFQPTRKNATLTLLLQGTEFQIRVWETLLHTRPGQTISYSQLAQMADAPKAQRAVGSAMAANPIAYLVPCHRVIKKSGALGNYGGGTHRKRNILEWESKLE